MNTAAPQYERAPLAPPAHIAYAHKLGRGGLTFYQVEQLVMAINGAYVESKQGKAYLAQHQARAEMNRIFGYGNWDIIADDPVPMYEYSQPGQPGTKQDPNKTYWITGYRMRVTISVRDLWGMPIATFTGIHAEQNAPLPDRGEAHAMAITSVESYALRRALINLGDRFGLGLYNGGSKAAHGQYTVQLEQGNLFRWQEVGQPQQPQQQPIAAPVQQPNHQTIQAEQAVPEQPIETPDEIGIPSDYDDAEPDGHGGVRSRTHAAKMDAFHQAQQTQQANREAAKQQGAFPAAGSPMASRLQQGVKVDEAAQERDFQRYQEDQVIVNEAAMQQARGGVIQ